MIKVREEYCPQNHPCPVIRVCPTGAIIQNGYAAPVIDDEKCTGCNKCITSCGVFTSVEILVIPERFQTVPYMR